MGSTLAGGYSMIIALLVFLFLVSQLMLRFKKNSSEYDQIFIKDSKHDVEFYLTELDNYLNQWADDTHTLRELLHARCGALSEKKLTSKRIQEQLAEFACCLQRMPLFFLPAQATLGIFGSKKSSESCTLKWLGYK
jgi:hypothetical protein